MAKKDSTIIWVLAGVAVVGYFAFKKGLVTLPVPGQNLNQIRAQIVPPAGYQRIPGVASELPDLPDIGIIAPALDPTGMQITLY
jgi:hypothetical protein